MKLTDEQAQALLDERVEDQDRTIGEWFRDVLKGFLDWKRVSEDLPLGPLSKTTWRTWQWELAVAATKVVDPTLAKINAGYCPSSVDWYRVWEIYQALIDYMFEQMLTDRSQLHGSNETAHP